MTDAFRYDGKPLLRLAEFYALWAIDALPEREREILNELAPKLQGLFGGDGSWQSAVAAAAQFPPDMPARITLLWREQVELAKQNDGSLVADTFVKAFVDANVPL